MGILAGAQETIYACHSLLNNLTNTSRITSKAVHMDNNGKLSKIFVFSLTTGDYIASGCMTTDGHGRRESVFHGYVPDIAEREEFWLKIKEARADQRNCFIFKIKDEYVLFKSKI